MTDTDEPKIAVIMTCYNEERYIGAAVRSVLDQTRADLIESIIIADDGSEHPAIAVLKDIETWDSRIKVLYGTGGAGLPAQRNSAIAETTAPILALLDGDDLWTSDKLERQIPVLMADPLVGLVYSDFFIFPNDNLDAARRAGVLDLGQARDLTRAYFLNDPPIIPSTTLIRRTAFLACGSFDASVHIFEDTDLYLRLSQVCRFALVDEPLLYKRGRKSSITGGRTDLVAHHAFVALKAASEDPRLLPLVPKRLAERSRKLGNQRFLIGDRKGAVQLLQFAVRLDRLNVKAWTSLVAASWFPDLALRLLGSDARDRQTSLGVKQP